jgi:hypothetical protein
MIHYQNSIFYYILDLFEMVRREVDYNYLEPHKYVGMFSLADHLLMIDLVLIVIHLVVLVVKVAVSPVDMLVYLLVSVLVDAIVAIFSNISRWKSKKEEKKVI